MTYTDPYNIAYIYLKDRYGVKNSLSNNAIAKLHKARNKKERNEIEASFTDDDYDFYLKNIPEDYSTDHKMFLLINQYFFGSAPKRELKDLLINLELM